MGSRSAAYQAASVGRSDSRSSQPDWSDCEPITDYIGESVEQPGTLAVHTPRRVTIRCLACINSMFMYVLCIFKLALDIELCYICYM